MGRTLLVPKQQLGTQALDHDPTHTLQSPTVAQMDQEAPSLPFPTNPLMETTTGTSQLAEPKFLLEKV